MSSFSARLLFGLALAFVLLASSVNAHGWMSYPSPRGQKTNPPKYPYQEYAPATTNPNDPMIACRDDPIPARSEWISLTAGTSQAITLDFNAKHVGDCFVYLSYDGDKPANQMKWFKIWERHECRNESNYQIRIPDYLPSGDHVVFRWEWYALHVYPTVEYYAQCVDATMTGRSNGQLPQPQVNIPGHLPAFAGEYAKDTNNYWWPWDNQPMFFTGPPVATPTGQVYVQPTAAPVVRATAAPATAAPATAAPATAAPATQAPPTMRPPPIAAATTRPVPATVAPVPATVAPVVPATAAPAPSNSACNLVWTQTEASSWQISGGVTVTQYTVTVTPQNGSVKDVRFTITPSSAIQGMWSVVKDVSKDEYMLERWMYNADGVITAGTSNTFGYIINSAIPAVISVVGNPCL